MVTLRHTFDQCGAMDRDSAVRAVGRELGYKRVSQKIRDIIQGDLLAASRRGIIERQGDELTICCRTIDDYDPEFLREMVLKAQERSWRERDEAIRTSAMYLGFRRVGPLIRRRISATIRTLVRRGDLESDGGYLRKG